MQMRHHPNERSSEAGVEHPETTDYLRGTWREWLDLAASLWDVSSLIVAVIAGLLVLTRSSLEIKDVIAYAAVGAAILVVVGLAFVATSLWINWKKQRPYRIEAYLRSLPPEQSSSLILLRVLLQDSGKTTWTLDDILELIRSQTSARLTTKKDTLIEFINTLSAKDVNRAELILEKRFKLVDHNEKGGIMLTRLAKKCEAAILAALPDLSER